MKNLKYLIIITILQIILVSSVLSGDKGLCVYTITDLNNKKILSVLNKVFRIKQGKYLRYKNVSFISAQDPIIYSMIIIDSDKTDKFKEGILFNFIELDSGNIDKRELSRAGVDWWRIDKKDILMVLQDSDSLSKVIMVSSKDKVNVYMYAGVGYELPYDIYDIVSKYGIINDDCMSFSSLDEESLKRFIKELKKQGVYKKKNPAGDAGGTGNNLPN